LDSSFTYLEDTFQGQVVAWDLSMALHFDKETIVESFKE
jgi:hypothetical protein